MKCFAIGVIAFVMMLANAGRGAERREVTAVPRDVRERLKLSASYEQYVDAGGLPVVASAKASPYALLEAAYLIDRMLDGRDDIRQAIVKNNVRVAVMATAELTTDIPEHADLKPKEYWNIRARGLGATRGRPATSAGEENLLCLRGDPYSGENILIHEFAHTVHEIGMRTLDNTFDGRLRAAYDEAIKAGLWKGTYAASKPNEYWAEGVQSWFDCNRAPDASHNDIGTRQKLKDYDPALAKLIEEVFGERPWRYERPDRRKEPGHLKGLDRETLPPFAWPKDLLEWKRAHQDKDGVLR